MYMYIYIEKIRLASSEQNKKKCSQKNTIVNSNLSFVRTRGIGRMLPKKRKIK